MTGRVTDRRSDKTKPRLSRVLQLRFGDEQYDRLQTLAAAADMSVAHLVRRLVEAQLLSDPDPADLPDVR